jgi:hypothetical protein
MDMRVVVESFGEFAYGSDLEGAVQEWLDAGFSPSEADAWLEAGCFNASDAASLRDAGVTPDQAQAITNESVGRGHYPHTIGYKVANGDMTVSEAVAWIEGN